MSDYLTIHETAEMFAVSTRTIRRWIDDGLIRAYRVGPRLLRIDIDSVSGVYHELPSTVSTRKAVARSIKASSNSRPQNRYPYQEIRELRETLTSSSNTSPHQNTTRP